MWMLLVAVSGVTILQTYSHVGLVNAAYRIAKKLDQPNFLILIWLNEVDTRTYPCIMAGFRVG